MAVENASRTYMPLEYSFTGRSMNSPISAKASMEGMARSISSAAEPHDFAVEIDVLAPAEFRIEAGAQFQQRRDAPARDHASRGGLQNAR